MHLKQILKMILQFENVSTFWKWEHQLGHGCSGCHSSCGRLYLSLWLAFTSRIWYEGNLQGVWKKCINQSKYFLQRCSALHRGAFCQFLFRFIHYCHKSTGKEIGKTHICALVISEGLVQLLPRLYSGSSFTADYCWCSSKVWKQQSCSWICCDDQ